MWPPPGAPAARGNCWTSAAAPDATPFRSCFKAGPSPGPTCRSACSTPHDNGSQPKRPDAGSAWCWRRWNTCRSPAAASTSSSRTASGTWRSTTAQFRAAVREAARVARPGASLFVFTFSRSTLPDADRPLPGEHYVFTRFSGGPQIFLTVEQLVEELRLRASRRTPPRRSWSTTVVPKARSTSADRGLPRGNLHAFRGKPQIAPRFRLTGGGLPRAAVGEMGPGLRLAAGDQEIRLDPNISFRGPQAFVWSHAGRGE